MLSAEILIIMTVYKPSYWSNILIPNDHISFSHIFLPFHTLHGVLKARILKWFAILFSSGPHFVRTFHHDPSGLGSPTWHGSQFHWVRQGCGPCDRFDWFSVIVAFILSALWQIRIRGWWNLLDRLTVGETRSCFDGRGCDQQIFNPTFCWWVGLCSLPVVWPETKLWWR